jgi:hypothetical protein
MSWFHPNHAMRNALKHTRWGRGMTKTARMMQMLRSKPRSEMMDKLVYLAGGDIDLVNEAIREVRESPTQSADLEKVVEYITAKRAELVAA